MRRLRKPHSLLVHTRLFRVGLKQGIASIPVGVGSLLCISTAPLLSLLTADKPQQFPLSSPKAARRFSREP